MSSYFSFITYVNKNVIVKSVITEETCIRRICDIGSIGCESEIKDPIHLRSKGWGYICGC